MEATIVQDRAKHYPVLLKEIISIITPQYGGTFIDCTFGQGGYSREILKNKYNKVIGLDRDSESLEVAKKVESNSNMYNKQLKLCENKLNKKGLFGIF